MQHNAAFHQGLHCLLRYKGSSDKSTFFGENYNLTALDRYSGHSQVFVSNQKEEVIGIQRVKACLLTKLCLVRPSSTQLDARSPSCQGRSCV